MAKDYVEITVEAFAVAERKAAAGGFPSVAEYIEHLVLEKSRAGLSEPISPTRHRRPCAGDP